MPPEPPRPPRPEPHRVRQMAESFGSDPDRYDRTRPRYPDALVRRIVAASPGADVLDVGCGTGIASRQFQAAGCTVLGVEVDARMAEFARRTGVEVEVARFEEWDPAGRTFDLVVSGQTWHWIDPVAGAVKAVTALGPHGRLAVFWNVFEPPDELGEAFAAVYRRVLPDTPFSRGAGGGLGAYQPILTRAADGIKETGAFDGPEQWRFEWERTYTREEWLDQVPTSGGHSQFPPETLHQLLDGLGAAIDAAGGSFTMRYIAVVVTAVRTNRASPVTRISDRTELSEIGSVSWIARKPNLTPAPVLCEVVSAHHIWCWPLSIAGSARLGELGLQWPSDRCGLVLAVASSRVGTPSISIRSAGRQRRRAAPATIFGHRLEPLSPRVALRTPAVAYVSISRPSAPHLT